MRIYLGIDPGPVQSGWCLYEAGETRLTGHVSGADVELNSRVLEMVDYMDVVQNLIIEEPVNYGREMGGTVLQTMRWAARFEQRWLDRMPESRITPPEVVWMPRPEVLLELIGLRHGPKGACNAALRDMHPGAKGTKKEPGPLYPLKSHAWDACAVVVAYLERERTKDRLAPV